MLDDEKRTVGELLQESRQAKGLTIFDVAEKTCIRRTYLQALEENRFDAIPGETYLTGFLRNYASVLGLNPKRVQALYLEQIRGADEDGPPAESAVQPVAGSRRRDRPAPWVWPTVVLLVLSAVALVSLVLPPAPKLPAKVDRVELSPTSSSAVNVEAAAISKTADQQPIPASDSAPAPKVSPAPSPVLPQVAEKPAAPAPKPPATGGAQAVAVATTARESSSPLTIRFNGSCEFRLKSLGPNRIEIRSASRPPQNYDLAAAAMLSWKFQRSARISIHDPDEVRAWIDDRPLDLKGRSEFHLLTGQTEGG